MTILNYNIRHVWRLNKYYRTEIKYGTIAKEYEHLMEVESAVLDPYFTADNLNHVLEIGPGMGVFSALIHRKYGPNLYMIDGGAGIPDVADTIGWRGDNPTPCADIKALRDFMFTNDILDFEVLELLPACVKGQTYPEYRLIQDDKESLDTMDLQDAWANTRFDLIVSLRSWCWHYDADLYLDFVVKRSIPHHTLLLVDMRLQNGQPEKLFEHFELVKEIDSKDDYEINRLLLRAI